MGGLRQFRLHFSFGGIPSVRKQAKTPVDSASQLQLVGILHRGKGTACPWGGDPSSLRCTLSLKAHLPQNPKTPPGENDLIEARLMIKLNHNCLNEGKSRPSGPPNSFVPLSEDAPLVTSPAKSDTDHRCLLPLSLFPSRCPVRSKTRKTRRTPCSSVIPHRILSLLSKTAHPGHLRGLHRASCLGRMSLRSLNARRKKKSSVPSTQYRLVVRQLHRDTACL